MIVVDFHWHLLAFHFDLPILVDGNLCLAISVVSVIYTRQNINFLELAD